MHEEFQSVVDNSTFDTTDFQSRCAVNPLLLLSYSKCTHTWKAKQLRKEFVRGKAHLVLRASMQPEGVDFPDTCLPVPAPSFIRMVAGIVLHGD